MTERPLIDPDIRRRLLVVEDETRLREMLLRAIPDMEFEAVGAASGEEAVAQMETDPFALAILDLNLPGMTGLELLERIRASWPLTQVVILTGFGDLDAAGRAIHLDVVDFLTKPCTLGDLEISLDRSWRRALQVRQDTALKPSLVNMAKAPPMATETPVTPPVATSLEDVERLHIIRALGAIDIQNPSL